jgi:GT2 family glycosyltransferase
MATSTQGDDQFRRLPATSLIICSRNRERMLVDTVHSILNGRELPSELVVIDQSDTPSDQLARIGSRAGCEVKYVPSTERGVSRGRNLGAAVACHEVLVFTDDDMRMPSEWFGSLVRALLREAPHTVVTGQVLIDSPERPGAFAPPSTRPNRPMVYAGRIKDDPLTPNMAIYRSLFEQAGGYDTRLGPGTRFPAAEDNDLGFRLLEMGCRISYVPEAFLYHRAWRDRSEEYRLCWSYEKGQGAFYAKHMRLSDGFMRRRLWGQIRSHAVRMVRVCLRNRRKALRDALSIGALLCGAIGWKLIYGATREPISNLRPRE